MSSFNSFFPNLPQPPPTPPTTTIQGAPVVWYQMPAYGSSMLTHETPPTSSMSGKERRHRSKFTDVQYRRLERHFRANQYPDGKQREEISREVGIGAGQIKVWFKNRRAKSRQEAQQRPLPVEEDDGAKGSDEETRSGAPDAEENSNPPPSLPVVQLRSVPDKATIHHWPVQQLLPPMPPSPVTYYLPSTPMAPMMTQNFPASNPGLLTTTPTAMQWNAPDSGYWTGGSSSNSCSFSSDYYSSPYSAQSSSFSAQSSSFDFSPSPHQYQLPAYVVTPYGPEVNADQQQEDLNLLDDADAASSSTQD